VIRQNSKSAREKSRSMAEISQIRISAGVSSIEALTEKEQERCIRIIDKYEIGGSIKMAM
jgi:hypothetical protein